MNTRFKWILAGVIAAAIPLSPHVQGETRLGDGDSLLTESDVDPRKAGWEMNAITRVKDSNSYNELDPFASQTLNANAYQFGDTLLASISITNHNATKAVDIYVGALFPDGNTISFVTQINPLILKVGFLDDPSSFHPLIKNKLVQAGIEETFTDIVNYTFTGNEPLGNYQFFTALTQPDAFQDGNLDEGDIISLPLTSFYFNSVSHIVTNAISPLIYKKGRGRPPTEMQTVGAAIGVYLNGKRYFFPFGTVNLDNEGDTPNETTLFQIGSVTKVFTTSLLGRFPFDNGLQPVNFYKSSIRSHVPKIYKLSKWQESITFEQLATFTAGIPSLPPQGQATKQPEFIQFIDKIKDPGKLPTNNHYSDSSIGFLGQILISLAGYADYSTSYAADDWYSQNLFTPLSMNSSGFRAPHSSSISNFYSYNEQSHTYDKVNQEPWVPWGTAGRTMSNINDMLNFIMANLGVKTIAGNNVPESLTNGMKQAISPWTNNSNIRQGFAWVNKNFGGQNMVFKNGGLSGGASAYIILCPNLDFGVVGLANTSAFNNGRDQVTHALATALQGVMVDFIPFAD